jgi:hypothetical protein
MAVGGGVTIRLPPIFRSEHARTVDPQWTVVEPARAEQLDQLIFHAAATQPVERSAVQIRELRKVPPKFADFPGSLLASLHPGRGSGGNQAVKRHQPTAPHVTLGAVYGVG